MTLVVLSTMLLNATSQTESGTREEKVFLENADKCLEIMEQAALKMEVKGAAMLAYIPGDESKSWISKMKMAGALANNSANFLAIAYSKAAEMALTFENSGKEEREPLHGEFGYMGGSIKRVKTGYVLAVFSGASGEQDLEIANEGLDCLSKLF